jgi:GNAT superfamily N-acetyltransferase
MLPSSPRRTDVAETIVQPLTPERWADFEDLFGPNGACGGCWCMWWRQTRREYDRLRGEPNRRAFRAVVEAGPPPGVITYLDGLAVGWCAVAPRHDLPGLDRSRLCKRVDEAPVWSVSCFYIRPGYRRRGLMGALIAAAVDLARRQGASAVEAYPWDTEQRKSTGTVYTGLATAFRPHGFVTVARPAPHRPTLRLDLT